MSTPAVEPSTVFEAFGLRVCESCGAPYCRECGSHSVAVASLASFGWPEAGFECSCGWAIGLPFAGPL